MRKRKKQCEKYCRKEHGSVYPRVNCIKLPENLSEKAAEVLYTHVKKISYLDGKITVSEIDYTATEKLRSGILLPEKISPHRWWIWILHRKDTGSEWRVQAVHSIG